MRNPCVTTDRTVDTSSLDSMVAGVVRPGMTDEQKALALYRFFTGVVYHYGWPYVRPEREENWQDPIKVINVHGYSLCGSQARVFGRLLSRVFGDRNVRLIGFTEADPGAWGMAESAGAFVDSARLSNLSPIRRMGHSSLEVRYGGRWRLIDPHVQFYTYLRGGGGIASAEDCIADPTLVTRPARRVRGLMPCGDLSRVFYASEFVNWGLVTREAAPDNHRMDMTLCRGDTYTRYWDRRGPFVWFSEMDRRWDPEYVAPGPRHICEGDECWRHYGNGELVCRPCVRDESYRERVTRESGLAPPGAQGLRPATARRTGRVTFGVRLPYMAASGELSLDATRRTGSDRLQVWVRPAEGRWHQVWQEPRCGRVRRKLDLSPRVSGRYGYEVRLDLRGGRRAENASVHGLTIRTVFLLNYLALPRLLPGRNRVRVRVADARELERQRLEVTYGWADREGEHEDRRVVTRSPYGYEVRVAPVATAPAENPKYMRLLRLSVT